MSKLDSKPMKHAQLSKSSHDLNHNYVFTSSTGMILPLVCDILNPGESIESKVDLSQTRTQPLDSAAYLDLDLHVDYFFVPLTLLVSKFESFIYRINDFYSNTDNLNRTFALPLMDLDIAKGQAVSGGYVRPVSGTLGYNFDDLGKGVLRLFDHLGYGTLAYNAGPGFANQIYNPKIFPWALLAYNAAYEYFYINDEYEVFNNNIFNVDYEANNVIDIDQMTNIRDIISLKYRNKYHDYFTRIKASPIVSGNNLLDSAGSLSLAKSWLSRENFSNGPMQISSNSVLIDGSIGTSSNNYSSAPDFPNTSNNRTQFGFLTNYGGSSATLGVTPMPNGSDINTANLRALFANEKLWTITGLNRKQYDAQTLAHFGFDVPTDVMHQVQHIGHHLYNLKVGEVISTAGTANQPLATVAGKGYAFENNDKNIRFTAPCHGVFIALYSSAIHRNYFNTFRKENAIATWQDFYQPEFDNLGMQPLFAFEALQDTRGSFTSFTFGAIFGWQYRYEQFKSRYDRSTFAFANNSYGAGNTIYFGPFASWSPSSLPYDGAIINSMSFLPQTYWQFVLKESPSELNNMMSISYDPRFYSGKEGETLDYVSNPYEMYQTDPLIHNALIHYTKLSTMSAYSMPKLND